MATNVHCHAVILAGGRGVRFWPLSRASRPKQLLSPIGGQSLLRRTFERLRGTVPPERIWVVTGASLQASVADELPEIAPGRMVAEPVQRNTAPAVGLAAALLLREDPEAVMGVFPADHHIESECAYRDLVVRGAEAASRDKLIVLGIQPTSPETGYGYIEFPVGTRPGSLELAPVLRFREKPDLATAKSFLASRRFYWNSGQFFWRARVLAEEMQRYQACTWDTLGWIADGGAGALTLRLAERYCECESISVDHAILERSERVAGFAVDDIGWSDLGSWDALHCLLPKDSDGNCARTDGTFVRAERNYVDVPGKHVALMGVDDLVVVETPDALLICRRSQAQNIRSLEQALREAGRDDLL